MSATFTTWVFQKSASVRNDRLVLHAIAFEADDDGHACMTIAAIARRARVPERTVLRAIARLERLGELVVTRAQFPGRGYANTYRVIMRDNPPFVVVDHDATRRKDPVTKRVRALVYERDDNRCRHCGTTDNLTIDHVVPVVRGGKSVPENLQTLCRPCNLRKGTK